MSRIESAIESALRGLHFGIIGGALFLVFAIFCYGGSEQAYLASKNTYIEIFPSNDLKQRLFRVERRNLLWMIKTQIKTRIVLIQEIDPNYFLIITEIEENHKNAEKGP